VDFDQLNPNYFSKFDAVAIGPGLGQEAETQKMIWKVVSSCPLPMVVDADALNAMARGVAALKKLQKSFVLTPHPGEMGRLIGKTAKEVQADRWNVARSFAQEYGVVMVLKGAGTVITDKSGKLWINSTGNPGMAKGGMGDALTGIVGSFLAQGLTAFDAARASVFFHGLAGDLANERLGARAMLTTDLIEHLGAAFATLD
jgi:NAD(P)H-hydrate epimerase